MGRYSVLMLDEISLSIGRSYNFSRDCIGRLVDFGNGDWRSAFEDHDLVFMFKDICKKWKQSICYYFCENSTFVDLVCIIK